MPSRTYSRTSRRSQFTSAQAGAARLRSPLAPETSSVIGGDIRRAIVARMGLNAEATHDVNALIATGNQAVATLTWVSALVLVLGGIGMASTLSTWYHRIYERTPPRGLLRHLAYQAAGVLASRSTSRSRCGSST
jgi:hypothetical protein